MKKHQVLFLLIPLLLLSCQKPRPQLADYLGVYEVIKVIENNETIKADILTHIELTESLYISRIDRDKDNKFSQEEISMSTMLFSVGDNETPQINISGNDATVRLLPDNYYDLLFERADASGNITTLFLNKVR